MRELANYICGRGQAPSYRYLCRVIDRYEWFTTARRARVLVTSERDPDLVLQLSFRPTVGPGFVGTGQAISSSSSASLEVAAPPPSGQADESLCDSKFDVDLIDRFIDHGDHRISPSVEAGEAQVNVDIDPRMVSAQLAEIYRAQGLHDRADEIYRLLNLSP